MQLIQQKLSTQVPVTFVPDQGYYDPKSQRYIDNVIQAGTTYGNVTYTQRYVGTYTAGQYGSPDSDPGSMASYQDDCPPPDNY